MVMQSHFAPISFSHLLLHDSCVCVGRGWGVGVQFQEKGQDVGDKSYFPVIVIFTIGTASILLNRYLLKLCWVPGGYVINIG